MNSYLYKRLNEVDLKLTKLRELKSLKDRLVAKLATVTSEFDEAKKSLDVQDTKELVALVNEVDKDYFVSFNIDNFTLTLQEKEHKNEAVEETAECAECEIAQEQVEEKQEEKVEEPRVESEQPRVEPEQQEVVEQVEQTAAESKEEVEKEVEPPVSDQHLSLSSLFKSNSVTE